MKKEQVIQQTVKKLRKLTESELKEASNFVDFLMSKVSDRNITKNIQQQAENSESFQFLADEEELYSIEDVKQNSD